MKKSKIFDFGSDKLDVKKAIAAKADALHNLVVSHCADNDERIATLNTLKTFVSQAYCLAEVYDVVPIEKIKKPRKNKLQLVNEVIQEDKISESVGF